MRVKGFKQVLPSREGYISRGILVVADFEKNEYSVCYGADQSVDVDLPSDKD